MYKRELTLEERKSLQLEMLNEIDAFCRANDIKYSLSCGTLIGAVRHHGFIPWDDDVDITMLYPDILRFRSIFKSDNLAYHDIDYCPNYGFHFSRIVSKKTFSKIGFRESSGVCIDLYPIIECTNDLEKIHILLKRGSLLLNKRLSYLRWNSRLKKYTPFSSLPGYKKAMRDYYEFMVNEIQTIGGGCYYQMGGPLIGEKNDFFHNMWSFNPLDKLIEVQFENSFFLIPARYDEFLTIRYGDYMQLPPKEERHPYHGGHYYWK